MPWTPEQGSRKQVSGVWREQKQRWEACLQWPAVAVEVKKLCLVPVSICLPLVPAVIFLALHLVNNIYSLHLLIEDLSLFGRLSYCTWIHSQYLVLFNEQVKGWSRWAHFWIQHEQKLQGCRAFFRSQIAVGPLSAVHCSSLIRLFVLLSGQTKQNILPMIQPVVGEDRGLLRHRHQRHHLLSALCWRPTRINRQA